MNERELQTLIDAYVDGEASQSEFEALQECIRTSPAARQLFVQQTHLHRQLHELVPLSATHEPAPHPNAIVRAVSLMMSRARQPTPLSLSVSVLVLCVCITAMAFIAVPLYQGNSVPDAPGAGVAREEFVAVLTGLEDANWAPSQSGAQLGARLGSGHRCELRSGWAEITFRSGAKVLLEGPAEFEITSDNSGHLAAGKIVAHVPEFAIGFATTTPSARVIDLGTEFGLAVTKNISTELHVFDGAVSAQLREVNGQWGAAKTFSVGEGVRIDAAKQTMVAKVTTSNFRRQLARQPSVLGSRIVARTGVDTASGVTLIYGDVAKQSGTCEAFTFYSNQEGKWITPLIFAFDPTQSNYRITGIGQSIQSDGAGRQVAPFIPVAGSADVQAGVYTFGIFDGRVANREQGPVQVISTNSGVVMGDFDDQGPWMFAHRESPRQVQLGRTYSLGGGSDELLTLGRTYSAQMTIRDKQDDP